MFDELYIGGKIVQVFSTVIGKYKCVSVLKLRECRAVSSFNQA